jgi:hypothetical protein
MPVPLKKEKEKTQLYGAYKKKYFDIKTQAG